MGYVYHDTDSVQFGDQLFSKLIDPVINGILFGSPGLRICKLAVTVVGERHVTGAPTVKILHFRQVFPNRVGILDTDHNYFFAGCCDSSDVCCRQCQFYSIRRFFLGQPVNRIEFCDCRSMSVFISFRSPVTLTDINDHKRNIQTAGFHLWKIDLGVDIIGIISFLRKIIRVYIIMSIEGYHPLMYTPRIFFQFCGCHGTDIGL